MICLVVGESRSAQRKNHRKLVWNRQNRVDILRTSAETQVYLMGWESQTDKLPKGDVSTGTTLSGTLHHYQPDSDFDGLPKSRLFQKGQEYHSPTFSEAPATPTIHSVQIKLSIPAKSSTTPTIRFPQRENKTLGFPS